MRAGSVVALIALCALLMGAAEPVVEALRADPRAAATFADALAARERAQSADAYLYAPSQWQRAENALASAGGAALRGAGDAARRAAEVKALYEEAELAAFATALLAEPRATLAQARKARSSRVAPQTTERAESLIAEAEAALATEPADRERARELAQRATAEARRALALATGLADAETAERTVRAWEDAVAQIARSAGVELPPDVAPADAATALVAAIEREQAARERLDGELADRNEEIRNLQQQYGTLASELEGVAQERVALARELESQAKARERLAAVERMFAPDEAVVLRERDDIVIRLLGLAFAPGSSKIGPEQRKLLDAVVAAIELYPDRDVIVEGHTDSAGGDDANLELSRARARSVREFLLASGRVLAARVTSEGYGETRPVASNDTAEGRARNRRIDVRLRALPAR